VLVAGSEKAAAHRLGLSHSTVKRAVEWLRALGESFQTADVPKEKADLMHAIYERINCGPRDCGCPADRGRLRARFGAGAAPEG